MLPTPGGPRPTSGARHAVHRTRTVWQHGAVPMPERGTTRHGLRLAARACRSPWRSLRDGDADRCDARRSPPRGGRRRRRADSGGVLAGLRTVDPRLHRRRLGALGASPRADGRAVPRRQLHPRADDALRGGADQPGPPAADELVPVSRARLAPVPALPEPAVDDRRRLRHLHQPRHGVPLVDVPAVGPLAARRLLVGAAVRAEPLDRGGCGGRLAVADLGGGHRVRGHGVHLARLRRVDPALGVVDTAARLGLHVPRTGLASLDPPLGPAGRLLRDGDGRPPLRDGVPRLRGDRRLPVHRLVGPAAPAPPGGAGRCRGVPRVGLGDRAATGPVPLGGEEPGPGGDGLENGYGARQILDWLFTGRMFDANHWFPIITIFVGVGILVSLFRWRTFIAGRALVTIFVVSL